MTDPRTSEILSARIADVGQRQRRHAGSPNPTEVAAYDALLGEVRSQGTALVLGMTPELRTLALQRFDHVVACDHNPDAHRIYGDWVDADLAQRETRLVVDWRDLSPTQHGRFQAILGDGIFANCPDTHNANLLLNRLRDLLDDGPLILRHVSYPDQLLPGRPEAWRHLVSAHLSGRLDAAELGFGLRMVGFLAEHWSPETGILDNGAAYQAIDRLCRDGEFSQEIWQFCQRYRFTGNNWIQSDIDWRRSLQNQGWRFEQHVLSGKDWYRHYSLYRCYPASSMQPQ